MFALLLRVGLIAAAGIVVGLLAYDHFNDHQRERPHESRNERQWRSSEYREPHDPWTRPSSVSRNCSPARRRRRASFRSQKQTQTDELCAGELLCSVCMEVVEARHEVYACKTCHTIFHLSCIQRWASVSWSTNYNNYWACPNCKTHSTTHYRNLVYSCMCGRTDKPQRIPGVTPHCCKRNCLRCSAPCHPGACD